MASGTTSTPPKPPSQGPERVEQTEVVIEQQLRKTQLQVKAVDIAAGLLELGTGGLVYLLAAAVLDQWVLSGGLGFWGRLILLIGLLVAGGWYFVGVVLPPLIQRINPLYAAHTIEESQHSLKNSLLNFLLLRRQRTVVPEVVYQAVQQRAAADLSGVQGETVVDRAHIIRLGYVLAGVVAVFGLYLLLSPKNPFTSVARVMWPWADIAAPTRVTIRDIEPGNTVAFHGEHLDISAEVDGLDADESVMVYYTTSDGQSVD